MVYCIRKALNRNFTTQANIKQIKEKCLWLGKRTFSTVLYITSTHRPHKNALRKPRTQWSVAQNQRTDLEEEKMVWL